MQTLLFPQRPLPAHTLGDPPGSDLYNGPGMEQARHSEGLGVSTGRSWYNALSPALSERSESLGGEMSCLIGD